MRPSYRYVLISILTFEGSYCKNEGNESMNEGKIA